MSQAKATRFKKHRWNKSQLIESNIYVIAYTRALQALLNDHDRQTLYMISKLFADATGEVLRSHYRVGADLYERGEKMIDAVDKTNQVLHLFLINIYDRSKSLYHHKLGEIDEAMRLIHNTLKNNHQLESLGFPFLLFDRVSQYHNLSKVYFGIGQPEEGFKILSDAIVFLMTGKASVLTDLNKNQVEEMTEELQQMRYSLLADMTFETTSYIVSNPEQEEFEEDSDAFFSPILAALSEMKVYSPDDQYFKDWLQTIQHFYQNDAGFAELAGKLLQNQGWTNKGQAGKNHLMAYLKRRQVI